MNETSHWAKFFSTSTSLFTPSLLYEVILAMKDAQLLNVYFITHENNTTSCTVSAPVAGTKERCYLFMNSTISKVEYIENIEKY